jgi:mannitol-1-phosphate/altronate dehydrogenase
MRQCEECGKEFKTGNSYRVHKHRFHQETTSKQTSLATVASEPAEQEHVSEPETDQVQSTSTEQGDQHREATRSSGGSNGELLAIGGAVAAIVLLLLFGKKQ